VRTVPAPSQSVNGPQRPRLELSGPKISAAFEALAVRCEEDGGIERYVAALQLKARLFGDALASRGAAALDLRTARALCAHLPTVRRRVGLYLEPSGFDALRDAVAALLADREDTSTTDRRVGEFCARFPNGRTHRWVRDFAVELLHNVDPERYPLMTRWVWDARANTGVLREIWHGPEVDNMTIDVPDGYETFLVLREELSQFLTNNGVFRDILYYVDLLTAQLYANYICEQGGTYLRTDFAAPEDPMQHTRRLLGLDGAGPDGRTRVKALDGRAVVVDDPKLTH
jgi:hypothetical protein